MPFELTTPTAAVLASVTPRTEVHGDDRVFAVSLGLKITGANTLLDLLSPALRTMLYKAVPDQEELPGVEPSTPLLRMRGVDSVVLDHSFEGWTLHVDHGIDEGDPITIGGAKVDRFKVTPKEGGSVELRFRIGSDDIDATEAGLLCSKLSEEITITLIAPKVTDKPAAIDGTEAQFAKDHPDAGDLFADAHGGPGDDDGDADSEGGELDVEAGGDDEGDDWPFPQQPPTGFEAPPQSVTVEVSRPGSRTARGRDRTKAALDAGAAGAA